VSGARYDAAVVGGGPVGAAAALAFARRGARVLLLEASPAAATRLAGEWLHPPGVDALARLGVDVLADGEGPTAGRGFAVFPDDGSDPVVLPYPDGLRGASIEHHALVALVRARACAHPGVDYRPGARVTAVEDGRLTYEEKSNGHAGAAVTVEAARIVGADGRTSVVRRALGFADDANPMSSMAGVELRGVTLPFEGYGHVVLGGPGPVLMYRIGPDRARACLDVPHGADGRPRRDAAALWGAFSPVLPAQVLPAFRAALDERRVAWAGIAFRPRAHYGRGAVALAGDAVGYFHPMTAAGMSLGIVDAERVAAGGDVEDYGREREAESYVPELLACGLYQALTRRDPSGVAIRAAVYRLWRASDAERQRTMRILACAETRPDQFRGAFNALALELVRGTARGWRAFPAALGLLREWIRWPVASILPGALRRAYRAQSTPAHPLTSREARTAPDSRDARDARDVRDVRDARDAQGDERRGAP
jgi:2-polyprenyl-6-methoxyphenol hydroxylase-like FAD-dependent oxidoreductase